MKNAAYADLYISIHAPRAGSDYFVGQVLDNATGFQSTPPVRGATAFCCGSVTSSTLFQSTPPVRGATTQYGDLPRHPLHFNPRPPCGERRVQAFSVCGACGISIHAPRAGSDFLPAWDTNLCHISIHAPRAGSDNMFSLSYNRTREFQSTPPVRGATGSRRPAAPPSSNFNPRPPCGERPGAGECRNTTC